MNQLEHLLQSMNEKIQNHPSLRDAYAHPGSGDSDAAQIAALYRQLEALCQRADAKNA